MYIEKTIMKFTILDSVVPEHPDNNTYSDTYKYLDEFLDDTFIMKYFTMREHSRRDGDGEHEK
jgi:hypothetical protein